MVVKFHNVVVSTGPNFIIAQAGHAVEELKSCVNSPDEFWLVKKQPAWWRRLGSLAGSVVVRLINCHGK